MARLAVGGSWTHAQAHLRHILSVLVLVAALPDAAGAACTVSGTTVTCTSAADAQAYSGGGATFVFSGTGSESFSRGDVFNTYPSGFHDFIKDGSGTWTLSGSTYSTSGTNETWRLNDGTLIISDSGQLGQGTGPVTFNGGTLQITGSGNFNQSIYLDTGGGSLYVENGRTIATTQNTSGSGDFTKTGDGTFRITKPFSGTGTLTVAAGTLYSQLSLSSAALVRTTGGTYDLGGTLNTISGLAGTGGVVAMGAGTLTVDQSSTTTYDGVISGTGGLTKTGTGSLTLNGVNTYSGTTTLNGGSLGVGDSSHSSARIAGDVTISSGTLFGYGQVLGAVTNTAGKVAPGGSVGTLTVDSYAQAAGGTLEIEVGAPQADKLVVTNGATIAGTLSVAFPGGNYVDQTYTILTSNSLTGTFSTVSGSAPTGFEYSVGYDAKNVSLTLTEKQSNKVSVSGVTTAGGNTLTFSRNFGRATMGHMRTGRSGPAQQAALTQFAALNLNQFTAQPFEVGMNGGLDSLGAIFSNLPGYVQGFGGWANAFGDHGKMGTSGTTPGFTSNGAGIVMGMDTIDEANRTVGVAVGYARANLDIDDGYSSTARTNSLNLSLYGSQKIGSVVVDAVAAVQLDHYSQQRHIPDTGQVAKTDHRGHEFSLATRASRLYELGGVNVLPDVGLQFDFAKEGNYTETGAPGANLSVAPKPIRSLRPSFGLTVFRQVDWPSSDIKFTPSLNLGYSRELMDVTSKSTVENAYISREVAGASQSRNTYTLGFGLSADLPDETTAFLGASTQWDGENYRNNSINLVIRHQF